MECVSKRRFTSEQGPASISNVTQKVVNSIALCKVGSNEKSTLTKKSRRSPVRQNCSSKSLSKSGCSEMVRMSTLRF